MTLPENDPIPSCRAGAVALALLCVASAHAQTSGSEGAPTRSILLQPAGAAPGATPVGPSPARGVEVYGSHSNLTAGYPDWREAGLRGTWQADRHLLQGELASMKRWGVSGTYLGVGDTYTFNDDWYASLAVGAGDGAHYLPRYRIDGFVHRKLLPARNLVANLGAGYYRAPDGHTDRNVSLGATYYFPDLPLVVQGEVRFTNGNPGSVDTRQHFVAATWGRQKETTVTGRYGWGEEGYQSIGQNAVLTQFRSKELSVAVRHWVGPEWGVEVAGEHYRNPTYRRNGVTVGVFWQTP